MSEPTALWAVPVSDLGGVARHVLDATKAGVPGWRIVVLCPPGPLAQALMADSRPVVTGRFGPAHGLAPSVETLRHAQWVLQPRVVHSHLSYADVVAALCKPLRGTALVSTEHGIALDDLVYHRTRARARMKAAVHTARLRRFDAMIAVSEATRRAVVSKWRPRVPIHVIHNGVDRAGHRAEGRGSDGSALDGPRVASLSRLAPEKRIEHLIDAFAHVHGRRPQATLEIAGEGPLGRELRRRAAAAGIARAVRFHGHVEPRAFLDGVDVLAQLSVWENLSYSLLDALVAGVGVVASPVGGNVELLPARCLVDAADPVAVARALELQAVDTGQRPALPDGWPTVSGMTARIADAYDGVAG